MVQFTVIPLNRTAKGIALQQVDIRDVVGDLLERIPTRIPRSGPIFGEFSPRQDGDGEDVPPRALWERGSRKYPHPEQKYYNSFILYIVLIL